MGLIFPLPPPFSRVRGVDAHVYACGWGMSLTVPVGASYALALGRNLCCRRE